MKTLARFGAVLSSTCFLLAGVTILANTGLNVSGENMVLTPLGLVLVGTACFVGPLLWLTGEKWCSRKDGP